MTPQNFKDKKVLIFGLGLLGGGVATANWLIRQEADVTITDIKPEKELKSSLSELKGKFKLSLGDHKEEDIKDNDIIIVNPAVPLDNKYLRLARSLDKQIENEATIFYQLWNKPKIAVTGTRGKTTTTNWTAHLIGPSAIATGNSYESPLLNILDEQGKYDVAVTELSSFLLELMDRSLPAPQIAIITNVYQDHINRHGDMQGYAGIKMNIFKNHTEDNHIILNADHEYPLNIFELKPKGNIWFFSLNKMSEDKKGIYIKGAEIFFRDERDEKVLDIHGFKEKWGEHNLQNLLAGALSAHLYGVAWNDIQNRIASIPQIPFRQETVFKNEKLEIINDTSATSPDGGIASIKRSASSKTILITGGTDANLDFSEWANEVKELISIDNIIFLEGSATEKMLQTLGVTSTKTLPSLEECLNEALKKAKGIGMATIVFSPASKSFEKFKNEFDRGRQFNELVKKYVR